MNSIRPRSVKKPYHKPFLQIYGSLKTMTNTAGTPNSIFDNDSMSNKTA